MLNKTKVIIFILVATFSLRASISADGFDDIVAQVRQLVSGTDFYVAGVKIIALRNRIATRREIPPDYVTMRNSVQTNGGTVSTILSSIQNAQDSFHAGDQLTATRALDLAGAQLNILDRSTSPGTRYAAGMRAVEAEDAVARGASPGTLRYTARAAYEAGKYSDSIALVQRELKVLPSLGTIHTGRLWHLAHTLSGLDYAGLGDDSNALAQLTASTQVASDPSFVVGPSMALAAQLLPRHPDAVLAYLDACSKLQYWNAASQVPTWKQQISSGITPDFGLLTLW